MNQLTLAATLCSKLCHDLVGPIGALNNGIEILEDEEDPLMRAQATELLGASAQEAARRLRFFRLAFGVAGAMDQKISLAELRVAAVDYFTATKIRLDWLAVEGGDGDLEKPVAKLLLNLILLAASALARGGRIAVRAAAGEPGLVVTAEGTPAALPAEIAAALGGGLDEALLDTHNVIAAFVAAQAHDLGGRIALETASEGVLRLAFASE